MLAELDELNQHVLGRPVLRQTALGSPGPSEPKQANHDKNPQLT